MKQNRNVSYLNQNKTKLNYVIKFSLIECSLFITIYIYIFKQIAQYFGLKTNLLQGLKEIYIFFCFILFFNSSSPCRKGQFAVSYFSTSLIVLIQAYNWEIRHHSLVCCCGPADILFILK